VNLSLSSATAAALSGLAISLLSISGQQSGRKPLD
jgi:hypothetical protein